MNTHVSVGDIIFLTLALAALLLLCHFFTPPTWLVLSFIGAGGALPVFSRVVSHLFAEINLVSATGPGNHFRAAPQARFLR